MAGQFGFSNPSVVINNVPIAIMPDSFEFEEGSGVINVRAMAAGGGSVQSVHTEDLKTKIGKVKFDLAVTLTNRQIIGTWKDNIGANVVIAIDNLGNQVIGNNMSLTIEPNYKASADGKVSIEFAGDPLIPA